jgi:hypothetical protein
MGSQHENKNLSLERKRCSDCARFKVPDSGCPWPGECQATDSACSDFYPLPKSKRNEEKPPHRACGLSDQGPFEAIYHQGKPAFLVRTEEGFKVVESLTNEGHPIAPKDLTEIPYEPYGFYDGPVPTREELFQKVRDEFELFLDVEPIYKDFLAACVLLSYQQEKVRTVPYVYFYGDNESGKTVALTLLSMLCYRPLFGVTIPAADIYGYLDDSDAPGTILEDEVQGLHKDLDKAKIYKAGYKQGAKIPRTFILQHKRFIKYFRCFCFKACAAEEMPRLKGLAERFVFIPMVEGMPKKDWSNVNGEDFKRFRQFRDMLLKWRLASVDLELPDVDLPYKGRLAELLKPIIQIVHGLPVEKSLRVFLEKLQQERLNEKANTFEGRLIKVVLDLYSSKPVSFNQIWEALVNELNGKLDEKKPNKMDTPEFGEITKQKVGYRLREVLSGKKKRLRGPEGLYWAYEFDVEKLKRIARKYGYPFVLKFSTDSTSQGVSTPFTPLKVHENHVEGMEKSLKKLVETPLEVSSLENSRTNQLKPYTEVEAPTVKNEVKPFSSTRPSLAEVLEKLRLVFVEGTEEEFLAHAVDAGLSKNEAQQLFENLKGEELFWFDREGKTFWRWVHE